MTRKGPEGGRLGMLAALGPFFTVEAHEPGTALGPGWRSWSDLVERPEVVRARVEAARSVLASGRGVPLDGIAVPVAASVVHLGLSARLLSPFLALAALRHVAVVPAMTDIRWRDTPGAAVPLSLPVAVLDDRPDDRPDVATDWPGWAGRLLEGLLEPLSRAAARLTPSRHVRAGNIASAVHGALTVLTGSVPAGTDAGAAARARDLGRILLDHPALHAAAVGDPGTAGFRRRNCCLMYRVAAAGPTSRAVPVCGDCVLKRS